jgi:uncharacterized Ntn-hydrolase superfamily protein
MRTYSLLAIDKKAGEMGLAVQSHSFSVGSVVAWAEPGVGVVATQALAEASYGPLGLALMKGGKSPQQALKSLLATDPRPQMRQVAMLDSRGRVSAYTGQRCLPEAGHSTGRGFSVQANLVRGKRVRWAIARSFKRSKGSLDERLMNALEAGEGAGGDVRGKQSAAILIVRTRASNTPWEDKLIDLRVEDNPEPLRELRRLLRRSRAYAHAKIGDELMGKGDLSRSAEEYKKAFELAPEVEELRFWYGIGLLNRGEFEQGRRVLKAVVKKNGDWRLVLKNLPSRGLLRADKTGLQKILRL